jgi:hypothetical protein
VLTETTGRNNLLGRKKAAMRMRSMFIVIPALAAAVLAAAGPAGASTAAQGRVGRAGPVSLASPASRTLDDVFNGDSCTTQPDNPAITSTCVAVGFFADGPTVAGLMEDSSNGKWGGNIFGGIGTVTEPIEVSCVPQPEDIPACVAVGEHYTNPRFPAQLVETGGDNGFSPVAFRNPKGASWSVLDDVSCASTTFCMLVGGAGTTRRTAHGLRYLSHATAYRWNGSGLTRLAPPAPAHARDAQLGGVSCPTATSCMAVGSYTNAAGRLLPYSALWTSGAWKVRAARTIGGKATTTFEAVACTAAATCVAVGEAVKPGTTAFAERYSAGQWTVQRIAPRRRSAFFSVSCPAASVCVAAGQQGARSLIERWNGSRWSAQAVPATVKPLTTDLLFHVSCVTPSICTAVGYRHNPAARFSFHTLALGWNGSAWTIQKTNNQ